MGDRGIVLMLDSVILEQNSSYARKILNCQGGLYKQLSLAVLMTLHEEGSLIGACNRDFCQLLLECFIYPFILGGRCITDSHQDVSLLGLLPDP